MGTNLPTIRNTATDEAHVIVRYNPSLDAECRLHYEDDGAGTPILVITFGDQIPADVALMQIRATAAPRYEIPEAVTASSGRAAARSRRDSAMVRARWQSDFDGASKRIPDEWLIRDGDWVGIEPGHCTCDAKGKEKYHCPVCLYASLARVGYGMGWLS